MADRTVTLHMTPAEEKALAELVSLTCHLYCEPDSAGRRYLSHETMEQISRINAALNAVR